MKIYITLFVVKIEDFKYHKISYIFKKILVLSIICSKCGNEMKRYIKKKNQLRYSKFLVYLNTYNYFKNMNEVFRFKLQIK